MNLRIGHRYKLLLLATFLMATLAAFIRYSDAFNLEEISVTPEKLIDDKELLATIMGSNLFTLPGGKLIDSVLEDKNIFRADLDFDMPDRIEIKLNEMDPIALLYSNGTLYSIDRNDYVTSFDNKDATIDFPVIIGVGKFRLARPVDDVQLRLLIEQLEKLHEVDNDFYLAISTIDITSSDYITVFVDGLSPHLKMYAGDLCRNMEYLRSFIIEFNPDLSDIECLDLRLEGQIIAAKK